MPTAREKLERPHDRKIVDIPPKMTKRLGTGTMLVPRPLDVDEAIRRVPKGRVATIGRLREALARDHGADTTCPLCTGIFLRIAAEAAEEDREAGKRRLTPWWRVVRDDGSLVEKSPGGPAAQAALLEAEGHEVVAGRGKKPPRLAEVESKLARL